jgi:hypothetical protein
MEQPSPDLDIITQVVDSLGALRRPRTRAEGERAAETAIAMLRRDASRSFPDAGVIRKIAENLCKALEPFGELQIPLKGCGDRRSMTAQELRSELDWLAPIDGPSARFDITKYLAAVLADALVNEFSEMLPTGTLGGSVREIAGLSGSRRRGLD